MLEIIKKGAPQFKANLHSHSVLSDGKLTPEEMKLAYKAHGYSVLAITDHEYPYDHTAMSEADFLMLTGYEAYIRPREDGKYDALAPEIHINLFARDPHNTAYVCYNDHYCRYIKDPAIKEGFYKVGSQRNREYTPEYINEFIRTAKENGYICTYNHPYWSMEDWELIDKYEGYFSMEMCNYGCHVKSGLEYNGQLYEWLLRRGKRIFCHSTDDNHNGVPLDDPLSSSFGGFTMILAPELTYDAVFHALETGNFYSSMGPKIHELYIDGDRVHIETDPVKRITLHNGSKQYPAVVGTEDAPITQADFILKGNEPFIRLTATDFAGNSADTRGIFRDELPQI